MPHVSPTHLTRRAILRAWLALPAVVLVACGSTAGGGTSQPPAAATTAPAPTATTAPAATATTAPAAVATATSAPTTAVQPTATTAATRPPTSTPAPAVAATTQPTPRPTAAPAGAPVLAATPACDDGDDGPTPAQTEGPYFKASSPERASLLTPGMAGTKLTITGRVLTTTCQPVARALLDFWQADDKGVYDNTGFTLRGHQFTDEAGRYRLETILPGLYPGRTRHIHVKVQAPNGPVLTTQLYFTGEARNANDGIFNPKLALTLQDAAGGKAGVFDFVLAVR